MGIVARVRRAWTALIGAGEGREPMAAPAEGDAEAVALRREAASVKLDLEEAREALAAERRRLAATEEAQAASVQEATESRLEDLFSTLAAPLSQLRMQEHLLGTGKAVAAADVMSVASALASAIERAGLEPVGKTGSEIAFDPETAQPLSGGEIAVGEMVVVKICGYRYHGRVLRKAFVERKA